MSGLYEWWSNRRGVGGGVVGEVRDETDGVEYKLFACLYGHCFHHPQQRLRVMGQQLLYIIAVCCSSLLQQSVRYCYDHPQQRLRVMEPAV